MRFDPRIAVPAALAVAAVAIPASSSADPPVPCPQSFPFPVPAALVNQGDQKDHNGNHLICAKMDPNSPGFNGGPDDNLDNYVDDLAP